VPVAVIRRCEASSIARAAVEQLASLVPGAISDFIPGMGHPLPEELLPRLADAWTRSAWMA
jgi:hypothetical protein